MWQCAAYCTYGAIRLARGGGGGVRGVPAVKSLSLKVIFDYPHMSDNKLSIYVIIILSVFFSLNSFSQ